MDEEEGAPNTLKVRPLPQEISTYIYMETDVVDDVLNMHKHKYHTRLISCRFYHARDADVDVFSMNLPKDFPFLKEMSEENIKVVIQGDEEDEDDCPPWTFVKLVHETLGSFYFLFQGAEPCAFFMDGSFTPCFDRCQLAAHGEKKNKKVTVVRVMQITPYTCSHCKKHCVKLLNCNACSANDNRFYYCTKECQRAHWPVHKTVCWKFKCAKNSES